MLTGYQFQRYVCWRAECRDTVFGHVPSRTTCCMCPMKMCAVRIDASCIPAAHILGLLLPASTHSECVKCRFIPSRHILIWLEPLRTRQCCLASDNPPAHIICPNVNLYPAAHMPILLKPVIGILWDACKRHPFRILTGSIIPMRGALMQRLDGN